VNPLEFSATDLVPQIRSGHRKAAEVLDVVFSAIRAREDDVHAFLQITEDEARAQAADVDRRIARGEPTGALAGIPVAIKDNMCVKGGRTTCASRILEPFVAPYDATVVAKLRAADAVFVGKTNLDEFAMGSSTENSAFGITRNPLDTSRVPGGSSGGSAAAVAAGMAVLALGSDTGGSIRQPASFCGIVGLKPTYSRISRFGLVAFASSLDQIGPMARTVHDAATLLGVLAGADPNDSTCSPEPVPDYLSGLDAGVKGMRLGVPREYFGDGLAPDLKTGLEQLIRLLEREGAEIVEISLPHASYGIATYYLIATSEASANLARYDGVKYGFRAEDSPDLMTMYRRTRSEGFGAEVKRRILLGTYALSSGYYDEFYLKAQKIRTLIAADFAAAYCKVDAILTPTTPGTAFKLGEKTADPLQMYLEDIYTVSANLAGIPGISVPAGVDSQGMPYGLQVLGPQFGEPALLRVARAVELLRS
jgi:aspartyl-tRNA(Asn)/glutamyl-tRNA(Gln) amidotransferase subunit A